MATYPQLPKTFLNHEWTRIDTNARACAENETSNKEDMRPQSFVSIRVHSCPFVSIRGRSFVKLHDSQRLGANKVWHETGALSPNSAEAISFVFLNRSLRSLG